MWIILLTVQFSVILRLICTVTVGYISQVMSAFVVIVVIPMLLASTVVGDASSDLRTLYDEFWEWRMQNNPTTSTYDGKYAYNDLMETFNRENFVTYRNKTEEFSARLSAIDRSQLDRMGKVNYDILNDTFYMFLEGNLWAEYGALSPISFLGGIQLFGGPAMASSNTRGDFENYIARLHAVQKQVDGIKELGRHAISLDRTLHNVSLERVPGQIDNKIFENPENSSYFDVFKDRLDNSHVINESDRNDIRERGRAAVTAYMNAFRDLRNFITDEYMPKTRTEYGVYAWDPTNRYYAACLKWHISFSMTPDEVHEIGLQEVDRISTEMHKIMTSVGHHGTIAEFFKKLEGNSTYYSNDTDKIIEEYKKVVFERIQPELPGFFKNVPDVPLVIQASSYDGLGGGYSSATETSPGYFTINLFRPEEVPFFEMMALSLHEANPGHHLQHSYSMKANLPDFRRDPILSFYNVPNWFPYHSAYGEGWALYSEYLGEEMGLYKDGIEMMGRYSYESLRAARLVVDTGLHYKKWSREEAILYLQNYTALFGGSAENEIDRYITWPGQACAYKLGEIKIRELRKRAEQELGSKFDLKEFHLHILENGAMPMSILENLIDDWIADMKHSEPPTAGATSSVIPVYMSTAFFLTAVVQLNLFY